MRVALLVLCVCVIGQSASLRAITPQKVRIGEKFAQQLIVRKVQPEYPEEARKQHVEGAVILKVTANKIGDVVDVQPLKGDPLLVPSAVAAVKQWKYRPYLLNGEPMAFETQVTVSFSLSR